MKYLRHLLAHKWRMLFQGLPLWLALAHDWDKLWPDEFGPYSRAFGRKGKYDKGPDFFFAWHKHQRRSKHHWQVWVVIDDDGRLVPLPIPDLYRREMLADWITAAAARGSTAQAWYRAHWDDLKLHPDTRAWVESELKI